MILEEVQDLTDTVFRLDTRLWAWAHFLGEARTSSNDQRRHRDSDRGRFNTQVDLLGALGELFLLGSAQGFERSIEAVSYTRDHLFNEGGGSGVKGPDFRFTDHVTGRLHELDVKTFDCSENKRFFAINDSKHRLLAGQCTAYFCLITPRHGRRMAVARLVPYAEVARWPVESLRKVGPGSPSRNLPIARFLESYFSAPPTIDELRGSTFSEDEIAAARADPEVREKLKALVPSLDFA